MPGAPLYPVSPVTFDAISSHWRRQEVSVGGYIYPEDRGSEDEVFQELKQLADIVYRFRLQRGSKFTKI